MATGFVNSLGLNFPLTVAYGGTGLNTNANPYGIVCAGTNSSGAYQQLTLGSASQVLMSNGAGALPSWESLPGMSNITWKNTVVAATTTALTATYANGTAGVGATLTNAGAQAAFAIDGVTVAVNGRVLIKNQASDFQNGIYTVTTAGTGATNWVLTRTTDYDAVAEITLGDMVFVSGGTVNGAEIFWQTQTVTAIGTGNPIDFVLYSGDAITSVVGTANQIDVSTTGGVATVSIDAAYVGQTSITTLGTITTGTWTGTTIAVAHGGTSNTTFTAYSPIFAGTTATGAFQSTTVGTAGQVLMSNGAGAIATFQTQAYSYPFVSVAGAAQTASPNTAYGLQDAAQVTVTLATSGNWTVGQEVTIEGYGAAGFIIQMAASQVANGYNGISTSAAGTITTSDPLNTTSSVVGCKIGLRYTASNTFFFWAYQGNFVTA